MLEARNVYGAGHVLVLRLVPRKRENSADNHAKQSSSPSALHRLDDVIDVQRVDLKPFCIELEVKDKLLYVAFRCDEEVYGWMEDIYSRSPLMGVSQPTNFVHQVHVGFDPVSGGFTVSSALSYQVSEVFRTSPQWSKLLTSSAITKEEAARHPEAVLDVLQFYTQQQLGDNSQVRPDHMTPTQIARNGALGTTARFEGVGLAGQQLPSTERSVSKSATDRRLEGKDSNSPKGRANESLVDQPRSHGPRATPEERGQVRDCSYWVVLMTRKVHAEAAGRLVAERKAPPPPAARAVEPNTGQVPAPVSKGQMSSKKPSDTQEAVIAAKTRPERPMSSMNEAQIMEKLRSAVSSADPSQRYSKIKKVGQGYVHPVSCR